MSKSVLDDEIKKAFVQVVAVYWACMLLKAIWESLVELALENEQKTKKNIG